MKLMIASDLHGSAYYVDLLLRRWQEEEAARLILLGDILYHGPRNALPRDYDTKAAAALLNAVSPLPLCVRGNCDGEVDQTILSFPVLPDFAWLFVNGHTAYLTHGHHREEAAARLSEGDLLFYGHTHVPDFSEQDGLRFINPGSVSIPKEGSPHSYLIWDGDMLLWKDVGTGGIYKRETI